MNFQQLEYIVAVDTYRHFATAAEKCFVTQPTLSMMIQKLEDELGAKIFDRSRQPVVTTEVGKPIVEQARIILKETAHLKELVRERQGTIAGELKVGIIPTLAPYLLPLFVKTFLKKYPLVRLVITELRTETIIEQLKSGALDVGILVTPLGDAHLTELPLFYEEFVVYTAKNEPIWGKKYVLAEDIDVKHLWLMEEGHCMRSQILNLCELRKQVADHDNFHYEAGSIETLIKMVEANAGVTILPELAARDLGARQQKNLRYFKDPAPVREVSLTIHRHYVRRKLVDKLKEEILRQIPDGMREAKKREVVQIG
ncbi:hydrogen peroxide-inducible genes activator [Dinghuibacter silviterrae]|uniref:LysR family hydrogen peroxide-inducible transcriptional activator n=1 Tax=Dinghuibacter silviterrae TaxID=1539049 RepID=A0A4R8DQD3_9BACT|nr:hydrogen peroxide-inducible genes activator [Dinghuibacter silviterrae]TDW99330.1 LysR family hydrogen peroxide-inducible transcriptional activator [Dinghuibacter silviterrae]